MTIQMAGTRVSGSPIITSLSSTANMRVGYFVFGTGIASGTTILSINSGTQITLSANASSTGTSTVITSPWLLNTGTIRLPDVSTSGRYRRSRTASTAVGQLQASQNLSHTHTGSGTTTAQSANHTHSVSGTTGAMSANASHTHTSNASNNSATAASDVTPGSVLGTYGAATINATNTDHTHTFSTTSGIQSASHTHDFSFTSASSGSTEARPLSLVVMTCVKT